MSWAASRITVLGLFSASLAKVRKIVELNFTRNKLTTAH